jgi:hypothetical protein
MFAMRGRADARPFRLDGQNRTASFPAYAELTYPTDTKTKRLLSLFTLLIVVDA